MRSMAPGGGADLQDSRMGKGKGGSGGRGGHGSNRRRTKRGFGRRKAEHGGFVSTVRRTRSTRPGRSQSYQSGAGGSDH